MNYPLVIKVLGYTLWVEAGCMVLPLLFLALLPRSSGQMRYVRCGQQADDDPVDAAGPPGADAHPGDAVAGDLEGTIR